MKRFTIRRNLWRRGKDDHNYLLRDDGKMCCLGFYAKACGFVDGEILKIETPGQVPAKDGISKEVKDIYKKRFSSLLTKQGFQNETCNKLIETNDSPDIKGSDRELAIKALFKKIGVTVTFKN